MLNAPAELRRARDRGRNIFDLPTRREGLCDLGLVDQDLLVDDVHDEVVELRKPDSCLKSTATELVRAPERLAIVIARAAVLREDADRCDHVSDEAHGLQVR